MNARLRCAVAALTLSACTGCIPLLPQEFLDLFGVSGGYVSAQDVTTTSPVISPGEDVGRLTGALSADRYQLFEIEGGLRGDAVTIRSERTSESAYLVALLDADLNLLRRITLDPGESLQHILRADSARLFAGVVPAFGGSGSFNMRVSRSEGNRVPPPNAQRVYLNFHGGFGVAVNTRGPVDFPAFDGSMIGGKYAGLTQALIDSVVANVRDDYREFHVEIYSSSEGPPPPGPLSVVHFGGDDRGLLGLADNVDEYNSQPSQSAMVYVGAFKLFEYMDLPTEDMALMLANVASHELGHLLGLYHTKDPADVMDTTGSVYDLASDQRFVRAALEPNVFPVGYCNSPSLLDQTVGKRSAAVSRQKSVQSLQKKRQHEALRRLVAAEMTDACGTCLQVQIAQPR